MVAGELVRMDPGAVMGPEFLEVAMQVARESRARLTAAKRRNTVIGLERLSPRERSRTVRST
jgi:hypothetical protein